ncbi:RNA polymerase sigma factor [Lederbergia sp. NSJ-179]|uniref:RNA polymerase sigma factor n=1 Tax=Lederbergia sp. NSJ-179 TaxID=2931402 RepID=UPI001FD4B410|nr:RNA polymerase sigma factor [Lederbergia sp. NSJ-179]MCJ7843592.1 RNA polymerase sigma factor [Lederbergia sp. NSJ-179]
MKLDKLLQTVSSGNVEALRDLYEILRVPVYAVALSILRNPVLAEDILQETFVRVFDKADQYQQGTNPKAWVISITRNLCLDTIRKKLPEQIEIDTIKDDKSDNPLLKLMLSEALYQLEEIERQIVVMHVIVGLKHVEISEELGMPAGTVRWKYRQSLKKLATIIGGDNSEKNTSYVSTKRRN